MHRLHNSEPPIDHSDSFPLESHYNRNYFSGSSEFTTLNTQMEIFPCSNPCTPAMSNLKTRTETFKNWRRLRTKATPHQLAEAGFYFLGVSDRVKCFYCNGGLQNWKYDQEPWFEHAKWFPNCEYLLKNKGIDFVERIASQFSNLSRPAAQNPVSSDNCKTGSFSSTNFGLFPQATANDIPSVFLPHSSHMTCNMTQRRLEDTMKSEVVTEVFKFGFDARLIRRLVARKLEHDKTEYTSVKNLVEDLQEEENRNISFQDQENSSDEENRFYSTHQNANTTSNLSDNFRNKFVVDSQTAAVKVLNKKQYTSFNQDDVRRKIRNLVEEQTCKVCLDNPSNCIFLPCTHLCCCIDCSSALTKCPICRSRVDKVFKIYFDRACI